MRTKNVRRLEITDDTGSHLRVCRSSYILKGDFAPSRMGYIRLSDLRCNFRNRGAGRIQCLLYTDDGWPQCCFCWNERMVWETTENEKAHQLVLTSLSKPILSYESSSLFIWLNRDRRPSSYPYFWFFCGIYNINLKPISERTVFGLLEFFETHCSAALCHNCHDTCPSWAITKICNTAMFCL